MLSKFRLVRQKNRRENSPRQCKSPSVGHSVVDKQEGYTTYTTTSIYEVAHGSEK